MLKDTSFHEGDVWSEGGDWTAGWGETKRVKEAKSPSFPMNSWFVCMSSPLTHYIFISHLFKTSITLTKCRHCSKYFAKVNSLNPITGPYIGCIAIGILQMKKLETEVL